MADKNRHSDAEYEEFVSIVAHDFNAPIRHVKEFSKLLLDTLGTKMSEEQRLYAGFIEAATTRLQKMQDDMLALSHISTRAAPFHDVDVVKLLKELAEEMNIAVWIEGDRPIISADPAQLKRLFQELLKNAVTFHYEPQQAEIKVSIHEGTEGSCVIDVADNGIGIDPCYHQEIFKMFRRLHAEGVYGSGSGAGLTIAKKIATRHSGTITLESAAQGGSIFHVTLNTESTRKGL